jgi:outer membrane protein OmpA-like peptidoglycan-associated protein
VLKGTVTEKVLSDPNNPNSTVTGTAAVVDAVVEILGLSVDSRIDSRIITNSLGEFSLSIEPNTDYRVSAKKNGYFKKAVTVTTKGKVAKPGETTVVYVNIEIDKIYEKREIVLNNIYFDLDASAVRPDAEPTLNELVRLLQENPSIVIQLGSHTDSRGSDRYNQSLSQKRSESVVTYLIGRGVQPARLKAVGYGETRLVNECSDGVDCTDEQHQQNRRTTFEVVANNYNAPSFKF